ncbi:hypothetical protein AST02_10645 [Staphylococcus equorum]|nr:hypothetical protein AST02_10645 [Staphylococcus equorum]
MQIFSDSENIMIKDLEEELLFLKKDDNYLPLNKENQIFMISLNELKHFFEIENSPCHIVNKEGNPLKVSHLTSNILFKDNSYLEDKDGNYYVYIDSNEVLTIVFKTKPSIFNFYNKDCEIIDISKDNSAFSLQFTCKYFKPTVVKGHIKVRNQKIVIPFKASSFEVIEKRPHLFQVVANIKIDSNVIQQLIKKFKDINNYNTEAYDLHFSYEIQEMPLSTYGPRIKATHEALFEHKDELWGEFDDNKMCLFKLYATGNGNLSCRIFIVPKLTYRYYKNMKSNKVKMKNNEKPIVICVEYPEKAQDNGFVFFKYLIEHYSEKFNIYYLLTDNSKDIENTIGYERNIIQYQSIQHLKLLEQADVIIHSHTPNYVLPYFTNYFENMVKSKNKVFLQHGIIASRNVSDIYGRKETNEFTNLFVVSSEREKRKVVENYNYPEADVIITGLARFDDIIIHRNSPIFTKKSILIMPTWRKELTQYTETQFKESEFFKAYNSVLNNKIIASLVMDDDYKITFYLHRNLQKFSHLFNTEYASVISEGAKNVNTLLKENELLITDYSSVGFDFALMHKKVIYYRPSSLISEEMTEEKQSLLPGDIIKKETDLFKEIQCLRMKDKYKEDMKALYKYEDIHACERIVEEMIKRFNI